MRSANRVLLGPIPAAIHGEPVADTLPCGTGAVHRESRRSMGTFTMIVSVMQSWRLRRWHSGLCTCTARIVLCLVALTTAPASAAAQQPPTGAATQQPPRRPANAPRTIEGVNTVWIEQLTQPELRDMIRDGYTTVLVLTGGVEDNSANLVLDKHNINNRLHGEMIAHRLGKTLVAPLVTLEPGNVGTNITPGRAGPMISQTTYRALLFDIGNFLRSMGFKEIYYLGDSGGNTAGMRFAADSLTALYAGDSAGVVFKHVAEYYNHVTHVQPFIQNELKIPEQIRIGASTGSSGLHEELAIDATMSLVDPVSLRYPQRVKAGEAEINGVKFESLEWLQDIGRKVAELRTRLTVDAINAYRRAR